MLEKAVSKANEIYIIKNGKNYTINGLKKEVTHLLEGSYSSPSYWVGSSAPIENLLSKDTWVVLKFDTPYDYMGECDTIFFVLKKSYDFLTIIRKLEGKVLDKCVTINLACKVDYLLNSINETIASNEGK